GLLDFHVPMIDMEAPELEQLDRCVSAIQKAHDHGMGVAVHCGAGLGRTGVVLATYFVEKGMTADNAIVHVRRLRPGSIETEDQVGVSQEYAGRRGNPSISYSSGLTPPVPNPRCPPRACGVSLSPARPSS